MAPRRDLVTAAVRNGRHYVGFDTDPDYIAIAEARVADAIGARAD